VTEFVTGKTPTRVGHWRRGVSVPRVACLLAALASVVAAPQTLAFGLDTHEQIVRTALAGQTSEDALDSVVGSWILDEGNRGADRHQFTPSLHFDSAPDRQAICDRWRASIDTLLDSVVSTSDPTGVWDTERFRQRQAALEAFGQATHALADFYSHSNYVELAFERPELGLLDADGLPRTAPLSGAHCDPKQLPAGLQTGYFNILYGPDGCPTRNVAPEADSPMIGEPRDLDQVAWVAQPAPPAGFAYCHEQLAKDEPDTGHGADVVPGHAFTYYQVATLLATKATRALWEELRQRFRERFDPTQWDADCLFDDLAFDRSFDSQPVGVRCRPTVSDPMPAEPPAPALGNSTGRVTATPAPAATAVPTLAPTTSRIPTPAPTAIVPAPAPSASTSPTPAPIALAVPTSAPAPLYAYLLGVDGGIGVVIATEQEANTRPSCQWAGGGLDCRHPAPIFRTLGGPYSSPNQAHADLKSNLTCGTGYWGPFATMGSKFYWLQNNVTLNDCLVIK
jgi:Heterokaryon incompatibility protein Het-C